MLWLRAKVMIHAITTATTPKIECINLRPSDLDTRFGTLFITIVTMYIVTNPKMKLMRPFMFTFLRRSFTICHMVYPSRRDSIGIELALGQIPLY